MNKVLVSLHEHNEEITESYNVAGPTFNGLECPSCKEELQDVSGMTSLMPPLQMIKCSGCSYIGYRRLK